MCHTAQRKSQAICGQVPMNSRGTILLGQNKLRVTQERPYNNIITSTDLEFEKGTIPDSLHVNCVILCKYIVSLIFSFCTYIIGICIKNSVHEVLRKLPST